MNKEFSIAHEDISSAIYSVYKLLDQELSQDWKSYTITINDVTHELNYECDPAVRDMVIKQLLKDALCAHIDNIDQDHYIAPFDIISRILNGARKEDHQFEIIKEEIVPNLDANGKPITAKPLNEESIYVQWQDQSKFKFEEENANQ